MRIVFTCALAAMLIGGMPVRAATESVEQSLLLTRAAIEDGFYDLAQKHVESLLDKSVRKTLRPEEAADALLLLARCLQGQSRFDEILKRLDPVKDEWIREMDRRAPLAYWRALALYEKGEGERALTELKGFEDRFADAEYVRRVKRLRPLCHAKTGQIEEALKEFEEFDRQYTASPEAPASLLDWGKTLVSTGRLDEARQVLGRLQDEPAEPAVAREGEYWMGQALLRQGAVSNALDVLTRLGGNTNAVDDLRARAWMSAAALQASVRTNTAAAVDALNQAIAQAHDAGLKREASFQLGRLLVGAGRFDEGVKLLKSQIAAAPDDPRAEQAQLYLSSCLLKYGKNQEAADEYLHYLETYQKGRGQAEAYEGRGWGLFRTGRYAEAATAFDKAYALQDSPALKERSLFKVADSYFANGQYKLALETYQRVLSEFPGSALAPDARFQAAVSLEKLGEGAAAEKAFSKMIDLFPSHPLSEEAMLHMAQMREADHRWLEAIDGYTRVMNAYTGGTFYAEALTRRGLIEHILYRFEDALRDFEQVVKDFPDSPAAEQAFYMRGMCYYGLRQDDKALSVCREFSEKYPNSRWVPDVRFWLNNYAYNQGDYPGAEQGFLSLVDKYPQYALSDEALLRAGMAASRRKEYVRSVELFARLAKDYPNSSKLAEARFAQAESMVELAKYSAAIVIFDEIINKYPNTDLVGPAWGRKGDCQFTLGAEDPKRYQESIESYRVLANNSTVPVDLVLQAEYKIGRSLEKLGRTSEAFEAYYEKVILRYLDCREKGIWLNEAARVWFTRAAFNAADIMEAAKDWRRAVSVLERVVAAGVSASGEATERINRLKAEHRWLF